MATFTIEQDKTCRAHLAALADVIKRKFTATAYQGDYMDVDTAQTLGDRLQVGTQRTIKGVRYLFIANVLISRVAGGTVAIRVSAWSLDGAGRVTGTWAVGRTKLTGVTLTANRGFSRRIGNTYSPMDMAQRIESFLNTASDRIKASLTSDEVGAGAPVQLLKGYAPTHPQYGEVYDTSTEHLLVFGGYEGAMKKLMS